ncbi:hypothetical protein LAZ67_6003077 [Cordylochernes scorpioides]|uniref:Reverse transcriptase domain-containing protein n=1 Tax=Cordylochernes scorpioides TaxID=51811 RepID=A0ABY6KK95_9ARAC|nr:hypothetical protein LAZ67_6003077 [Cordylochernes scorpioides]
MALEAKLGKGCVYQLSKMEGHILVGSFSVQLAERLIEESLIIKEATLRAFPLRKKAERIAVENVPFFVTDIEIIVGLKPFGGVTSIVQQIMELDNSSWADARREAFITLNDGIRLSQIPARLEFNTKGVITPVYEHEIDIRFMQEINVISLDNVGDLCHGYSAVVAPATTTMGSGLAWVFAAGVVVHLQQILWSGKMAVIDLTANLVAGLRSLAPAVAKSGGGYIERASLFVRRRLENDTARSDYLSLSDLGRSLRARRRSPSTFTDDDGKPISGSQLRRFLLERSSSRFAQAPISEEAIADFLAEVSDKVALAARHDTPLAVISLDLKSAFGTLSRSYLFTILENLGLPSTFFGWIAFLYGAAVSAPRSWATATTPDLGPRQRGRLQGFLIASGWLSTSVVRFLEAPDGFSSGNLLDVRVADRPGLHHHCQKHRRLPGLTPDGAAGASHREVVTLPRGMSLVGRAQHLGLGSILHHLHGYLSPETFHQLQARLASFVWSTSRGSWLPWRILARPVPEVGVGLLVIVGQLRLAYLKGVQDSFAAPPTLSPRKRRLLSLWEAESNVLELDHRVLRPACLRCLRLRGGNTFLRPPDLLAPERWLRATHLGTFCQRLLRENASSSYHAEYEAETIVLRGSVTPFTRLTSQRARRALDSARLQEHLLPNLLGGGPPLWICPAPFSGQSCVGTASRSTTQMSPYGWFSTPYPILTILPGLVATCAAFGSNDGSLTHRYWSAEPCDPCSGRDICLLYKPSQDLEADIFTKDLSRDQMKKHLEKLSIVGIKTK